MKKPTITFSDFAKLDIRVGEVKKAGFLEGSKNILSMKIDLGEEYGVVEILAGIANYYKPEDLVGNKYPIVANLEPKRILDHYSNGMMMAADDNNTCLVITLNKNLKNGLVIR